MRYRIYPASGKGGASFYLGFGLLLILMGIASVYFEISGKGGLMTLINNGTLWDVLKNGSSLSFAAVFCFLGLIFLVSAIGIIIKHKKEK